LWQHQRVGVFIDVQNMFYSAKHQYNAKLNFAKFLEAATRGRQLVRAIAYVLQTPEVDQTNFINMLKQNGFEVRVKELRIRNDGTAKGDWDLGIAVDTLSMADRLDTIVLATGDGDFAELVRCLRAKGVRVEIFSFPHSTSEELKRAANDYYEIGPELLFTPERKSNGRRERPRLVERTYRASLEEEETVERPVEETPAESQEDEEIRFFPEEPVE